LALFILLSIWPPLELCHTTLPSPQKTPNPPSQAQMMGTSVALEALKDRISCQCRRRTMVFRSSNLSPVYKYLPSYPGLFI